MRAFLLFVIFTCAASWAQSGQTPASAASQPGPAHHDHTMATQHQQTDAMKADVEKMKSALAKMKANVAGINDPAEKARWQANVDLWETMVGHMEQMQKHMQSMGPGMMHHDMGHGAMDCGMMHHDKQMEGPPPHPLAPADKPE